MLELTLPFRVRPEGMTGLRFPLSLQCKHLAGIIENRSRSSSLCSRPFCIRQRTKRWRLLAGTDIAGDEVGLFEWNVQFGVVRKFEGQDLLRSGIGCGR